MAVSFRVIFLLGLFVAAASAKSLSFAAVDDSTTPAPIVDDSTTPAPIVDDSTTPAPIVDDSTTLAPVDDSTTAGTTRTPYTKPTDVPDTIPTSCDGLDFLFIPAPGDCSKYIVCNIDHPSYLMPCPAGLEFSYKEQLCDWPWIANCGSDQAI